MPRVGETVDQAHTGTAKTTPTASSSWRQLHLELVPTAGCCSTGGTCTVVNDTKHTHTHMIEVTRTMHMRLKTAAFFRQRTRGQSGCQWLMGCPQSAGCHLHPRSCVVHITQQESSTHYNVANECVHGRNSPVVTYFKLTRSPMVLGMNPDRWFSKSASSLRKKANEGRQSDDKRRQHAVRRWAWAP